MRKKDLKAELNSEAIDRYKNLVSAIVNNAISKTEGLTRDEGIIERSFGVRLLKDRNVYVHIDKEDMQIDLHASIVYGNSIPDVVAELQERIKTEIEGCMNFTVSRINVNISGVQFA